MEDKEALESLLATIKHLTATVEHLGAALDSSFERYNRVSQYMKEILAVCESCSCTEEEALEKICAVTDRWRADA